MTVSPNPTYASELFGAGHGSPVYPASMTPMVTLLIPENLNAVADDASTTDVDESMPARNHDGSVEVTFTVIGGTFDANVTGLMFDNDAGGTNAAVAAPAAVASIVSGGRKGDNSITIKIEEADQTAANNDGRNTTSVDRASATGSGDQTISFAMPRLANVALAGANAKDPVKRVWLSATSRIISGTFTDGPLAGTAPHFVAAVIQARDSLTLSISDANMKTIAISDDAAKGLTAFMSVKEKNKDGYVELATVTIMTKQLASAAMAAVGAKDVYKLQEGTGKDGIGDNTETDDKNIYSAASAAKGATYHELYDLDGEMIDEGLRGSFSVDAMGTRDLFNEDDMLFVDYDGNGKMGAGESIAIDGAMGMGGSLSIDPDRSESFDKGGTGMFKVYYMPGGKGAINHGAMINLTAMVDYSDPSAIDEAPAKTSTTLNFDGVGNPVMAYAIPHSTNGTGDKGNVRVRCEASAGCRVFLECWDDMGMRGFGEAPMIGGNSVMVWSGEDIEGVTGMEPTSRHSCRVLSKGAVTVQQLTRDGNSGTLVNNTYVGGS